MLCLSDYHRLDLRPQTSLLRSSLKADYTIDSKTTLQQNSVETTNYVKRIVRSTQSSGLNELHIETKKWPGLIDFLKKHRKSANLGFTVNSSAQYHRLFPPVGIGEKAAKNVVCEHIHLYR